MTRILIVSSSLFLILSACGPVSDGDMIEEATWSAALSEGDGENLDGVPAGQDDDAAAAEDADGLIDDEADLDSGCGLEGLRQRIMNRYDHNGNGRLERAERRELASDLGPLARLQHRWMRHYRLERLEWAYDGNEDGQLQAQERQQLRADLEMRCQNRQQVLLQNFDADQDGSLSEAEWDAAREQLRVRIQARLQEALAQHDANQNGMIDEAERQAMIAAARQRMQQAREQLRLQFDGDGDGFLDEAERAQLREAIRARIRGEQFDADSF